MRAYKRVRVRCNINVFLDGIYINSFFNSIIELCIKYTMYILKVFSRDVALGYREISLGLS